MGQFLLLSCSAQIGTLSKRVPSTEEIPTVINIFDVHKNQRPQPRPLEFVPEFQIQNPNFFSYSEIFTNVPVTS